VDGDTYVFSEVQNCDTGAIQELHLMKPNSTHSHKKSIGKKCLTFTVIYDMVKV